MGIDSSREALGPPEAGKSRLRAAFDFAKGRMTIALLAHTVLTEDTKRMVQESLDKMSADRFMSDALDNSMRRQRNRSGDEEEAAEWLVDALMDDVSPRLADPRQANVLLTFFRGVLTRQSI